MGKEGKKSEAPPRFELGISCLLDRRFNQLSHGAAAYLALFYQLVFPVHSFTGGKGVSVVLEAIWNGKL